MANEKNLEARLTALEEENAEMRAFIKAKLAETPAATLSPDVFMEGLKVAMKEATKGTELLAAQQRPSNPDHLNPQLGPFEHPKGGKEYPKPQLTREMWFAGARLRDTEITYAEAIALNDLSASLSRGQRRLCRNGKWKAIVSDDDARLVISVPMKTIDDRADLPSLLEIVQELTTGERALDHADVVQELAMLKAQFAAMQAVPVAV